MSVDVQTASTETAPESSPLAPPPDVPPDARPAPPLTLRQEEFCRHYAATGNAAAAARDAGYAEGSARQTGHDLLDRPKVAERVRAIRAAWRAVEREEAQILLGRLEQAWDVAVEKGSASLMIRVVKLQADLSGLDRRHAHRRTGLWPLPGEVTGAVSGEEGPRPADAGAADSGPLAEAVRRGRHRTERALALHRANRMILEEYDDFDEADWLATAQRLHATVEERRRRTPERAPDGAADRAADRAADGPDPAAMTNHDISLHSASDPPAPDSAPDAPTLTEHDIALHRALHRAGLTPATAGGGARGPVGRPKAPYRPFFFRPEDSDDPPAPDEGDIWKDNEAHLHDLRARAASKMAASRREDRDAGPDERRSDERRSDEMLDAGDILPPAGDPCPIERAAAEEEQDYLKELARTRPPLENRTAGAYLAEFDVVRPCRGD